MPSDRAVRQRRYRLRQARRLAIYRVQAGDDLLFALLVSGRLTESETRDRVAVETELAKVVREWAGSWWK